MDTGMLAKNGIFVHIFKGIQDTLINYLDMGIQCFLNLGDICYIYFRNMGFSSK